MLPDFRNLGVMLRILVLVNLMGLAAALAKAQTLAGLWQELIEMSALLQPILILSLVLLSLTGRWLLRLSYRLGATAVLLIEVAVTLLVCAAGSRLFADGIASTPRCAALALLAGAALLGYFNLRSRALSPALTEARLQALQARIRPHFLFNSINAVLSLIRADPKRAETALEDLADLFRALMADNRRLAPLKDEVVLCRRYLELEQLRLGERLQVEWQLENMPADALIPPLLLQPLVENAVYHGIEPSGQPGLVSIRIYRDHGELHALLRNPCRPGGSPHSGNKMALDNIRERLDLHFDAEGRLEAGPSDGHYQVHITIPYLTAEPA